MLDFMVDPFGTSVLGPAEPGLLPEVDDKLRVPLDFGPAEFVLFPELKFRLVGVVFTVGEFTLPELGIGVEELGIFTGVPVGKFLDVGDTTLQGSDFAFGEVGGPFTLGVADPLGVTPEVTGPLVATPCTTGDPLAAALSGNVLDPGDGDLTRPNSI